MHKLLRKTLTLLCVGVAVPLFSQTWTQTTSLFEAPVTSINTVTDPVTLLTTTYAAFKGTGVLVSTDGYSWTNPGNAGLAETSIERLSYINNTLYAGTHGFLFASTDGAASWASVSLGGMPLNPTIFDIALFISIDPVTQIATSILLAATDKGIYSRTGNAPNWNQVGAKNFEVRKLLVIPAGPTWPAAILAGSSSNANGGGSGGNIWRSTDGVTFTRLNLTAWSFRALEQDPLTGTIYAGGRYKFFAPGGCSFRTMAGRRSRLRSFQRNQFLLSASMEQLSTSAPMTAYCSRRWIREAPGRLTKTRAERRSSL